MVGVAFGQCGRFQQCRLRNDFRVDGRDGEAAFGQRTGLVEDDGTDTGQCFQMVGPFYENPFAGCTSYAGEKVSGMDTTRAQGQEMTRKMRARLSHTSQSPPASRGGTTASRRAAMTTAGV